MLNRNVIHKIYVYKMQDHLGNRSKMRRATGKTEATLLTAEYLVYRSQLWNCRMHGDKIRSQRLLRCSKNISIRNNSPKDMTQKEEINRFSEASQKLFDDMNQTSIFELCENSAKHQCLDCKAFSAIGIIYFSCGRNWKYARSSTTLQKTTCDFSSIFGFVTRKNSSRGPEHGVSLKDRWWSTGWSRC